MKVDWDLTDGTVAIYLETKEEIDHLRNILDHDVTVGRVVHPDNIYAARKLGHFMYVLSARLEDPR